MKSGRAVPRAEAYEVKPPCKPGYEGKGCVAHYWRNPAKNGGTSVSFYYYDTLEIAQREADKINGS